MAEMDYGRPMSETEVESFTELDEDIYEKYEYDSSQGGKWMMFFFNCEMDDMWLKACRLYHAKKLIGIRLIKTSTSKFTPRATGTDFGAIRFSCGPCDDEKLMRTYGKNLAGLMDYHSKLGFMAYKSDKQSGMGTRATGNRNNTLYRFIVPMLSATAEDRTPEMPMSVMRKPWLFERDEGVAASCEFKTHSDLDGRWMMIFRNSLLDSQWTEACKLYRDYKLEGIHSMKTSTAMKLDSFGSDTTGIIMFNCGPYTDEKRIKCYGTNLAQQMKYFHRSGFMKYKSSWKEGEKQVTYQISVASPWVARGGSNDFDD